MFSTVIFILCLFCTTSFSVSACVIKQMNIAVSSDGLGVEVLGAHENNKRTLKYPELPSDQAQQQSVLLKDLLNVLNGGEGLYVRFVNQFDTQVMEDRLKGPQYSLSPSIDRNLRDVVEKICAIGADAYVVRTFADRYSSRRYGTVNQALASAYRVLYSLYAESLGKIDLNDTLYAAWVHLEDFSAHLQNARRLVYHLVEKSKLERERKRTHQDSDLRERATAKHLVEHGENEALIELRGGAVLRELSMVLRREMGDQHAVNLYEELVTAASEPYLSILSSWLDKGEFVDLFDEFAIKSKDNPVYSGINAHSRAVEKRTKLRALQASRGNKVDDFWDQRFSVRLNNLPLLLNSPQASTQLLGAGVCLNIIRDIGGELPPPVQSLRNIKSIDDPEVVEAVRKAFVQANSALLRMLHSPTTVPTTVPTSAGVTTANYSNGLSISSVMQSLYEVFLSGSNEVVHEFIDSFSAELDLPRDKIKPTQIQVAWDAARDQCEEVWAPLVTAELSTTSLRDSLLSLIAQKEDANNSEALQPHHSGAQMNDNSHLSGHDCLWLDFRVPYPFDIVVPKKVIRSYQFLSRYIMELQHTNKLLVNAWRVSTQSKLFQRVTSRAGNWFTRSSALRNAKVQLVDALLYCTMVDGIQPEYRQFLDSIDSISEVNQLVSQHTERMNRILTSCLLLNPTFVKIVTRMLKHCRQYSLFMFSSVSTVENAATTNNGDQNRAAVLDDVLVYLDEMLLKYEMSLRRHLFKLYELLSEPQSTGTEASAMISHLAHQLEPIMAWAQIDR